MLTKITYNRTVTDEGDFVTSADIYLNKNIKLTEEEVAFQVEKQKIEISSFVQNGREIHVEFPLQKELGTMSFDMKLFVDKFAYPQIKFTAKNFKNEASYLINFKEDEFISHFTTNIFQHGDGQIAYYQYGTGTTATKRPLVIFLHGSGERGFGDKYPLLGTMFEKL